MKIRLSFTHIASLGLLLFVVLQVLLTIQALELSDQASEVIQDISGPQASRLKRLTEIDKSLNQAHYLYLLDKNKEQLTVEEILGPLSRVQAKLQVLRQKTTHPKAKKF